MRRGVSVAFANINRGKQSITLDLGHPDDMAVFFELVKTADVLLANWRPGVADDRGLTDEALWERNPGLVTAWITGFGYDGPAARRPGFDSVAQGHSGLAYIEGDGDRPTVLKSYIGDKVASLMTAETILAGLLVKERTGRGTRVEISLLDALAYFNFPDTFAIRTLIDDDLIEDPYAPPSLVRTNNGHLVIAPSKGSQVRQACEAAGHPEWVDELRSVRGYRDLAPRLIAMLETVTVSGTTEEWLQRFLDHDVPVAAVLNLDQHLVDPQVLHNGTYGELDDPRLGRIRYARYPAVFATSDGQRTKEPSTTAPFPELGEHSDSIRARLSQ
jgi:crotonobetainyl-CoA:carnitine CoA-transferase CaiB-like acyl-CoA transferase